jgi:hypothetical protein
MLRRHLPALAAITRWPAMEYRVRQYFNLGSGPFLVELRRAGLCQADLVLCLIRMNTSLSRKLVEQIVGKPITVGAACLLTWNRNSQSPSIKRQPIITWVCSDAPLRMRGVSKGDLRRAMRRGWIRVEGVQ